MRSVGLLRRQVALATLTANAIRPVPGYRTGFPSFVAGWLTGELAPQLLALTVADTAVAAVRGRASRAGLLLAALNAGALSTMVTGSRRVKEQVEEALEEGIGVDYAEQLDAKPTPAELATPWRALANPFRVKDARVAIERDLVFTEAGSRGHLDLYRPADGRLDGAPVLVQIHGGAWTVGRKDQQGVPLMLHLASKGWVCVAINYRLAPRDAFPAQIVDVKRAIAWVKEHIDEYGGDPDYVVITGGSAGGHLAALAALTPGDPAYQPGFEYADTSVQAAIPHYGIYDFAGSTGLRSAEQMRDGFLAPRILQRRYADDSEPFEAASPLLRITPDAPDFFVLHGVRDTMVSVQQARLFVERLRQVGKRSVVYAELPGAQHGFDIFPSIRSAHVVRAVDRYLHWHWNGWRRDRDAVLPG